MQIIKLREPLTLVTSFFRQGIVDAESDRERATERFVRLEKSRTEPGSGLGLSLAKAVMKLHKGSLKIGSANPGLSVELVFPKGAAA